MAIGGNITAIVQVLTKTGTNSIGEAEYSWVNDLAIRGWLDYSSGDADGGRGKYRADVQESTHVFLCDYKQLAGCGYSPDRCRFMIGGKVYQVLLLDNPMERNHHWEVMLKFVG